MQKIKAVIFDIDGTLANTVPLCIAAFRKAVEPLVNRPLSDEEIVSHFGPDEEGTIKSLAPDDYKKGTSDFMQFYEAMHDTCSAPFEGITELLQELKQKGVRLSIATGKGKYTSELTLNRLRLATYFEKIENGTPEGSKKAEAIATILHSLGDIGKEGAVYIGDAPGDITESRKAGIKVVSAAWAETAKVDELKKEHPDELFTSVAGFTKWIKANT
ncbi:MAG: HAD family hydrolase [Bacteroidota bacterium]|nr:HAD family hydrolase [Bacteroidota bacterium]